MDLIKNFGFIDETTISCIGINGKMSEFNAALGILQLKYIEEVISKRQSVERLYRELTAEIKGVRCLPDSAEVMRNSSYFPIFITDQYPLSRDELYFEMKKNGFYGRRYFYPLISNLPMYRDLSSAKPENLPMANLIANQVICLPIYPDLPESKVKELVDFIYFRSK